MLRIDVKFETFQTIARYFSSFSGGSWIEECNRKHESINMSLSIFTQSRPVRAIYDHFSEMEWVAAIAARAPARRVLAVPETRIFTLKTDQTRSGAPHFQAQNGSSTFRSPAFSRPFFTLPRHIYLPKFGVSTPPPPGYRPLGLKVVFRYLRSIRPSIYSIVPVKDSTWQNYKIYKFAYILTLRLVTNSKALYMRYSLQCT